MAGFGMNWRGKVGRGRRLQFKSLPSRPRGLRPHGMPMQAGVKVTPMKILAVASTMDLRQRLGCTPAWWQLWKALYEIGHEVIVTPYLGDPVDSLWWRTYPNPCRSESLLFNRYLLFKKARRKSPSQSTFMTRFIRSMIRPKWKRHLQAVLWKEG